jgi:hypothetical protein
MLHKDSDLKGSVAKEEEKKTLVVILKRLDAKTN